jgi:hypothetical protein
MFLNDLMCRVCKESLDALNLEDLFLFFIRKAMHMKEIILAVVFTTFLKTTAVLDYSSSNLIEQNHLKLELLTAICNRNRSVLQGAEIYYSDPVAKKLFYQGLLANLSESQKRQLIQGNFFVVKKPHQTMDTFFSLNLNQTDNSFVVITEIKLSQATLKAKL